MIRPFGPFTVRPLRIARKPRRKLVKASGAQARNAVAITPARRPVKSEAPSKTAALRVIGRAAKPQVRGAR